MSSAQGVWELSRAVLGDQDGWITVLKVYMDESGTLPGSPVVTVGAYFGRPSVWRDWTKEWNRTKAPIKVFHAVDCANRDHEFKGWERPARDAYVAKLLPVIARHDIAGLALGLHLESFRQEIAPYPDLRALFGVPYAACFQWAVSILIDMIREGGRPDQRLAFFHEHNDYEVEALKAFSYLKDRHEKKNMSIAFAGKDDYVPLQAADVLAYEANHLIRNPDPNPNSRPKRLSVLALDPDPDNPRIRLLYYGPDRMREFIRTLLKSRDRFLAAGWDGKMVASKKQPS